MGDTPASVPDTAPEEQLTADILKMRAGLKEIPVAELLARTGTEEENGRIRLDFFFQSYTMGLPDFAIEGPPGETLSVAFESIVYTYLTLADGTPPSGRLIGFRELPDGINYSQAFQGYAPDRLSGHFGQDLEAFGSACRRMGADPVELGDAAFRFQVFPRIPITAVYYLGDEALPSGASLLFDDNVTHYMVTAGLASIGSKLVSQILKNDTQCYCS